MNADLPTGWQGKALALLILLVALTTAYLVVAAPLLDLYRGRAAHMASQRALLVKLGAIAAELPVLGTRLAELRVAADSHNLTLDGASDAIASATLQGHIEQSAAASGVTVGSTEILPMDTEGEYHRVGLRMLISGSYESMMKLLATIETATPPLVVDGLQIHSLMRRAGASKTLGLDASLEISGFRANEIGSNSKP